MSFSSFVYVMCLAAVLTLIGIFFTLRSHKKDLQKRNLRRYLADKMQGIPLPAMLQALGINGSAFIQKMYIDDISECIRNCEKCTEIDQCNEKAKIPDLKPDDLDFCLNEKYFHKSIHSPRSMKIDQP